MPRKIGRCIGDAVNSQIDEIYVKVLILGKKTFTSSITHRLRQNSTKKMTLRLKN